MKPIETPVFRATASSIARAFRQSKKKHLLLTGSRGCGKSTLAARLLPLLTSTYTRTCSAPTEDNLNQTSETSEHTLRHSSAVPGFTTSAVPHSHVTLTDLLTGETAVIGRYPDNTAAIKVPASSASLQERCSPVHEICRMSPVTEGFTSVGISALQNAASSESGWALLDELGYLESDCLAFQHAVEALFANKQVLAILRKQSLPFLDALRNRDDVFLYDLDAPLLPVGCVIMASGYSSRFGSNKLLASFHGSPLITHILDITGDGLFSNRIVVTRYPEVRDLCEAQGIPVLLHQLPAKSDTIRLGLTTLQEQNPQLSGCLFATGDQPLLTRESLETMLISFSVNHNTKKRDPSISSAKKNAPLISEIGRLCFQKQTPDCNQPGVPIQSGNPVLFGNAYFDELLHLSEGTGGNQLCRIYPEKVQPSFAKSHFELLDADTPEELDQLASSAFSFGSRIFSRIATKAAGTIPDPPKIS